MLCSAGGRSFGSRASKVQRCRTGLYSFELKQTMMQEMQTLKRLSSSASVWLYLAQRLAEHESLDGCTDDDRLGLDCSDPTSDGEKVDKS